MTAESEDPRSAQLRADVNRRIGAAVLFSDAIPGDTPVPKVRELIDRLTDLTMKFLAQTNPDGTR